MDAFATFSDLGLLLNRNFTFAEQPWITGLLESASTYLREDVIGQQVYPQTTSTFLAWPDGDGTVTLPQFPVIAVTAVTADSVPVDFVWRDDHIETSQTGQVAVTFTYGYATPPAGLTRWACVLVSQALIPLELNLGLTVGGLSSVAVDDFKAAFADAGDAAGMQLNDRNIELIRSQYASGVHVGGMR